MTFNMHGILLLIFFIISIFSGRYLSSKAHIIMLSILIILLALVIYFPISFVACFYGCQGRELEVITTVLLVVIFALFGGVLGTVVGRIWKRNSNK